MLHSILISHNLYVLFYDILLWNVKMLYEYIFLFWFSIVKRLRMALLIRALYKIGIIIYYYTLIVATCDMLSPFDDVFTRVNKFTRVTWLAEWTKATVYIMTFPTSY